MMMSIVVALILAVVGVVPFMGLTGAIVLSSASPTTNIFYGPLAYESWQAGLRDQMWPLSILVSVVWPFLIPLAYLCGARLFPESSFFSLRFMSVFLLVLIFGCVFVGQTAVVLSGSIRRLSRDEMVQTAALVGDTTAFKSRDFSSCPPLALMLVLLISIRRVCHVLYWSAKCASFL